MAGMRIPHNLPNLPEERDDHHAFPDNNYNHEEPYRTEDLSITPTFDVSPSTLYQLKHDDELFLVSVGCNSPQLLSWKRQLDGVFGKPIRKKSTIIEWKTTPKRTKPPTIEDETRDTTDDARAAMIESRQRIPEQTFASYIRKQRPAALRSLQTVVTELSTRSMSQHARRQFKRVRFAEPMVTLMAYRPRTPEADREDLYFQEDELRDWEVDRATTSPEQVELFITKHSRYRLHVSVAPVIAKRR